MAMTVKKRRDSELPRVFVHKTADIRGGVSVATSDLGGDYLREGAVLSAPVEGTTHVVKIGVIAAEGLVEIVFSFTKITKKSEFRE